MTNTLAQGAYQIGIVVPDIHKSMAFFKGKLGVPEFLFIEKPELQDETYLGKPAPLHLHLAFGWAGEMQVELIQPIAGVSTYSKFLEHNPKGGIHHYGIEVPNYAQGVKEMEAAGYSLVQGGRHNETRFAYFDTIAEIGTFTEVVYLQPEEKAFMLGLSIKIAPGLAAFRTAAIRFWPIRLRRIVQVKIRPKACRRRGREPAA